MSSIRRRWFLRGVGATVTSAFVAGCSLTRETGTAENPPAGSLEFHNRDSVPHEISVEVLNVGDSVGNRENGHSTVIGTPEVVVPQRDLTATVVLEPGQKRLYESVFQSQVWHDVRFTVDDKYPGEDLARTVYNPAQPGDVDTGQILGGDVSTGGELSWYITVTEDRGIFQ